MKMSVCKRDQYVSDDEWFDDGRDGYIWIASFNSIATIDCRFM